MSCFKLPSSLCKQIHSVLMRFWWDEKPGKRKMSWVAWDKITLPKFAGGLGFKDIEAFNDAFLAKLSWRLLQNPNSLLAKILLGKYCHSSTSLECKSPGTASHGWRRILIGRDLLLKGLGWSIGDGSNVRVWHDPWLSMESPQAPIGPPPLAGSEMLVKDLICPLSKDWNVSLIQQNLPQYDRLIRSLPVSKFHLQDSLIWLMDKTGQYTTKTGYQLARQFPSKNLIPAANFNWNKSIWQIKTAPKVKNFLWKAASGALSLGSNLAKRGLMSSITCKRCGNREDELHLFINCPFANRVWDLAPIQKPVASGMFPSVHALLTGSLLWQSLPPTGLASSPLAPWIFWNLWKARNYLIFEDRRFSEQELISKAICDAKEWQDVQPLISPPRTRCAQPQPRQATPHTYKCFTDAAWCPISQKCGQGWILYDGTGAALIQGSANNPFVASAIAAEATAMRGALMDLASRPELLGSIHHLEMLSDSQGLISSIKTKASSKELKALLHDITRVSESFASISFSFVPRLANVVSDSIAKSALVAANSSSNGD